MTFTIVSCYNNNPSAFAFGNFHLAINFRNNSLTFRLSRFKKFFNPRQTLGNIITCNTTGMEGTHCQLGTRFTDGLGGYYSYRFTDINMMTGS